MKKLLSLITALTISTVSVMPAFAEGKLAVGDINGDGTVNVTDISLIAAHVKGQKALPEEMLCRADINGDERIDVGDLAMLSVYVKGSYNEVWDIYGKLRTFITENDLDAWIGLSPNNLKGGGTAVSVTVDGTAFADEANEPKETLEKHGDRAYKRIVDFMEKNGIDPNKVMFDMLD
ncbi:dockerin type I repeat-containing protein [uncultured Ruminococcus sp.]|uniref:dockerin type I repeat-containing protein n=1 Tax=uncultured Ruminococcus sp. TaxID=165186 RepID=UPI0025E137A9|nr:dockerin type I repeat-containing protein [uncultured Ruminococcus sp.]